MEKIIEVQENIINLLKFELREELSTDKCTMIKRALKETKQILITLRYINEEL
jgi:uncharacterized UBP type Zn finger protein